MAKLNFRSRFEISAEELFEWHMRPGAFERLNPPWAAATDIERSGALKNGAIVKLRTPIMGLKVPWKVEHFDFIEGRQFCDRLLSGPFKSWTYIHRFEPQQPSGTLLDDELDFTPFGGRLGEVMGGWYIKRELKRVFNYRHRALKNDLEFHQRFKNRARLKIAISGTSGLVGFNLKAFLESGGHTVFSLVRSSGNVASNEIRFHPPSNTIDGEKLNGLDAVIHLGGVNIAEKRWSPEFKKQIAKSRIESSALLALTLAKLSSPPATLINASAIGFYGDRGDEILDESSAAGHGFLPQLAKDWEESTKPAIQAGIRTVNLRIGVVVSPLGGALKKMLLPFRLGLGGRIGNGMQWVSWISLDDLIGAINFLLFENLSGPVNAVSPQPIRNLAFSQSICAALKRPCFFHMPGSIAKVAFGEMAQETVLSSSRVLPKKLEEAGFYFHYPQVLSALNHMLGN